MLKFLLNLFFPISCVGCEKNGCVICDKCLNSISTIENQQCPTCRKFSDFGKFCSDDCRNRLLLDKCFFDNLIVCSRYDKNGLLKRLIENFKYTYNVNTAEILGSFFDRQKGFMYNFFDQWCVVPVPLHASRLRERGFNQSEILAKNFCEKFNLPLSCVLIRDLKTEKQMSLSRDERLINVKNAFSVCEKLVFKNFVLIDDVCTTGSTLNECAKVLKLAGASKVSAVVLARGDFN